MKKQNWENAQRMNTMHDKWIVDERVFNKTIVSKPQWVDLGLPSGILWADRNIGSNAPEDYGLYFQWGDVQGFSIKNANKFNWSNYKWCSGTSNTLTKYNYNPSYGTVDKTIFLENIDDAAYQQNTNYKMPSKENLEELLNNTTSTWETLNDVNGIKITASNGNFIFIPANGQIQNDSIRYDKEYCYFWTNMVNTENRPNNAYSMYANSSGVDIGCAERDYGLGVRAIKFE